MSWNIDKGMPGNGNFDILVVDDHRDNILLVKAFLKKAGYRIATVMDGQEVAEKFNGEPFGLVLWTCRCPGDSTDGICHGERCEKKILLSDARNIW